MLSSFFGSRSSEAQRRHFSEHNERLSFHLSLPLLLLFFLSKLCCGIAASTTTANVKNINAKYFFIVKIFHSFTVLLLFIFSRRTKIGVKSLDETTSLNLNFYYFSWTFLNWVHNWHFFSYLLPFKESKKIFFFFNFAIFFLFSSSPRLNFSLKRWQLSPKKSKISYCLVIHFPFILHALSPFSSWSYFQAWNLIRNLLLFCFLLSFLFVIRIDQKIQPTDTQCE